MKKLYAVIGIASVALGLAACNENNDADRRDYNSSARMLREDNASINATEEQLEQDRAEKAAAKARGDTAKQASSSFKIGADHVANGAKKTKKYVDRQIHEEHEEDLKQ